MKWETSGQCPDCAMHYPLRTDVRATAARLSAGNELQRLVGRAARVPALQRAVEEPGRRGEQDVGVGRFERRRVLVAGWHLCGL